MENTLPYEKEILEAYTRCGFKPLGNQLKHISEIITAYRDDDVKTLVLSAPTGTGKSVIGVVVAEVLNDLVLKKASDFSGDIEPIKASFLLTATNALSAQYYNSFADGHDPNFLMIKGAGNYECAAQTSASEYVTAENCARVMFRKNGMEDMLGRYCNKCEYAETRARRDHARHVVTNYSYYFIDRMYAPSPMAMRTITVFDEAHLLNDLFTEHNAIYFSEKRLAGFVDEIAEHLKLGNTEVFKDLKNIREGLMRGKITQENYTTWLRVLASTYQTVYTACQQEAERNSRNQSAYMRFSKLGKKYHGLFCKIDDLFTFEYPVVFEYKAKDIAKGQNEHECSIKPIFVGDMFATLENSQYNLLMSATITEELAKKTMTLPGKVKYMRLDPQFPKENKKVVFFKPQALNYNTMKDPKVVTQLCLNACQIVNHHSKKNQRGIILAPSFKVAESVAASIRNMGGVKVFEHIRGEKLADLLEDFKRYSIERPAVIITPSGYEGVDLPGDLSRYQILLKHPFGSLGDKRTKTIMEQYPTIYQIGATAKVVQGAGRSVRGPEDWAVTYCLDTATQRAWSSPLNEWKNEFTTSFSSNLTDD